MKVQIKQKDGIQLTLYLPSSLIGLITGSRLTRTLILKALQNHSHKKAALPEHSTSNHALSLPEYRLDTYTQNLPDLSLILTPKVLKKTQREIPKLLKKYKHLQLVDIGSADGPRVTIIL